MEKRPLRQVDNGIYTDESKKGSPSFRIKLYVKDPVSRTAIPYYETVRGSLKAAKKRRTHIEALVNSGFYFKITPITEKGEKFFKIVIGRENFQTQDYSVFEEQIIGTKSEARARMWELVKDASNGKVLYKKITLKECTKEFMLSRHRKWENKTKERYEQLINGHILPALGEFEVSLISPKTIEQFYEYLRENGKIKRSRKSANKESIITKEGLSERTILHAHRTLSQIFKFAVDRDKLDRNPCQRVTTPSPSKRHRSKVGKDGPIASMQALTWDQVNTLLEAFKGSIYLPIVVVAALTGMRRGEILALKWGDIDLEEGSVEIIRALEETKKGVFAKDTKNSSSSRTISLCEKTLEVLKRHRAKEIEYALQFGIKLRSEHPVFRSHKFKNQLTEGNYFEFMRPSAVTFGFTKLVRKIESDHIFKTIRFHDLRHTHASILMADGEDLAYIQKRLGHSSPNITLNTYSHCYPGSEKERRSKLSERSSVLTSI